MLCGSLDGEFGGEWIQVCVWRSPFAVQLKLTTLLISYSNTKYKVKKKSLSSHCSLTQIRSGGPCPIHSHVVMWSSTTHLVTFNNYYTSKKPGYLFCKIPSGFLCYFGGLTCSSIICCCSVAQLCPTLFNPMDCSPPGFPKLNHLPEFAQTHVH